MTIKSKLLRNFGANAYGQVVTVLIQLVSVPLYLGHWGVALYGEWLILSAIPAYLALSDIGFASVAANDMTMKVARKDERGALCVYQSVWVLISCIAVVVGILLALLAVFFPVHDRLSIEHISSFNTQLILMLLVAYVLVGLQGNVLNAAFRSIGRYAFGTALGNTARLIEWAATMFALWLGYGVVGIALAMLVVKVAGVFAMWIVLNRETPWLKLGVQQASFTEIKRLWRPAVAFMAFPLGLALSLQGIVLAIGMTLGAAAVVMFSVYRTLTRLLVQIITLLNHSAWPEISAAYGANKIDLVARLHRSFSSLTFWLGLCSVVMLSGTGEWMIRAWTRHAFQQNQVLLVLMLLTAFLNVMWQTSWVVLMATNQHQKITAVFLLLAVGCLTLSYLIAPALGIDGIGMILAAFELPMLYIAIDRALVVLNDGWYGYAKSVVSIPRFRFS